MDFEVIKARNDCADEGQQQFERLTNNFYVLSLHAACKESRSPVTFQH
jgi:hypothetical protein